MILNTMGVYDMNKYEFRYWRDGLFILFMLSLMFLNVPTTVMGYILHSFLYSIGGETASMVVFWVLFAATIVVPILIASNSKGYGVLHRDYAEINLGFGIKVREIEYAKIKSVFRTGYWWRIEVAGERNVYIKISTWPKHTKELEIFMEALEQKLPESSRRR